MDHNSSCFIYTSLKSKHLFVVHIPKQYAMSAHEGTWR
jgi:hypothetical protein